MIHPIHIRFLCFGFLMLLFFSCSKDPENQATPQDILTTEQTYFLEVSLQNEFGSSPNVIKKWGGDIKIFLPDTSYQDLNNELDNIITELNDLSETIKIYRVHNQAEANFIAFFGNGTTYAAQYEPNAANYVNANWGLVWVYWNTRYEIYKGSIYVDVFRTLEKECQLHLLREELTQALGLLNDSYRYPESIFYQGWTCTTGYAEIDKKLIQFQQNPLIKAGMSRAQAIEILKQL